MTSAEHGVAARALISICPFRCHPSVFKSDFECGRREIMKFRTYVEPPEPMRGLEVPPEVVESLGQGKRPRLLFILESSRLVGRPRRTPRLGLNHMLVCVAALRRV
jgi:hypothetical protein